MDKIKLYRLYGFNMAVQMLRPNANFKAANQQIVSWDDPRPCPTSKEINETLDKIMKFEDSINTIWLDKDIEKFTGQIKNSKEDVL